MSVFAERVPAAIAVMLAMLEPEAAGEIERALSICLARRVSPGAVSIAMTTGRRRWPAYSPKEAITAVRRCARAIGRTPSSSAYVAWRGRRIRDARRTGADMPRLPGYQCLARLFGGWEAVLVACGLGAGASRS